jgi:carotenoid cleavage dioxygenase-like enzyme
MKTGAASQKQLSVSAVDFPRVNESYTGRYKVEIFNSVSNVSFVGVEAHLLSISFLNFISSGR